MNDTENSKELDALRTCMDALEPLTPAARTRVMRYLAERFPPPMLPGLPGRKR